MQHSPSISAFFPTLNDSYVVVSQVEKVTKILSERRLDFEVIVINDGSTDDTGERLDALAKTNPYLRVIHHAKNEGYGGALISGFSAATKDWVFYTDGDGQYNVEELENFISKIGNEVDLINGHKRNRSDGWQRAIIGRFYNFMMKLLFGLRVKDVDCDFRLIRRTLLTSLSLGSKTGLVCVELVKKLQIAGCRILEVPVNHYPRCYGKSQFFSLRPVTKTLMQVGPAWFGLVLLPSIQKSYLALNGLGSTWKIFSTFTAQKKY